MKLFICFILLLSASFQVLARTSYVITGITGAPLVNIEKRLEEAEQDKPFKEMSESELQEQVLYALEPYGYLKAKVSVIKKNSSAQIDIQPGPLTHITAINIELTGEGAKRIELKKTIQNLPIKVGDPLLIKNYNHAKKDITNTAEQLGYLHGTFSKAELLLKENNTAEITWIFNTGPLFYFGQVQFNPTNISPELLHRYTPFHYRQVYSTDLVLKLNNDLSSSGYFNSVLVKPQIHDDHTLVPIEVQLQPVPKYSYSLGAGYGTDTGIRGRAGLYVIPVNKLGHKFNTIAQGSFNQNALQAQYLIPGNNPVTDQYNITGNFSNLNYATGYSNAFLLSAGQQHNKNSFKRTLSLNALYERFNYSEQPANNEFVLYPKANITLNKTSNPLFSPTGYNIAFNGLGSSTALLSNKSFVQGGIDAKGAYQIEPIKLRIYGQAIFGITAINDINQLPLTLAQLLGGTDNLRAFSYNAIGPGKILQYQGIELQKEIIKKWYAIAFYDTGDVYDPTPKNRLYDTGIAVMWVSPVGPIKLGLAQEINSIFHRVGTNPRLIINMGPDL